MATVDAIHIAQQTLIGQLARALVKLLMPRVGTKPKTSELVSLLYPTIKASRRQQALLADSAHAAFRKDAGVDTPIVSVTIRDYLPEHLESGLGHAYDETTDLAVDDVKGIVGVADKHSSNAYRNTMQAYAIHDEAVIGWARVSVGSFTCNWCLTLISRGPVYNTAKTAGENDSYHNYDDCQVVPVFSKTPWDYPGGDVAKQALADYQAGLLSKPRATGKNPRTGAVDDAVNAELTAVRARIQTLEAATPQSESAKKYVAAQLARNRKQLVALTGATTPS